MAGRTRAACARRDQPSTPLPLPLVVAGSTPAELLREQQSERAKKQARDSRGRFHPPPIGKVNHQCPTNPDVGGSKGRSKVVSACNSGSKAGGVYKRKSPAGGAYKVVSKFGSGAYKGGSSNNKVNFGARKVKASGHRTKDEASTSKRKVSNANNSNMDATLYKLKNRIKHLEEENKGFSEAVDELWMEPQKHKKARLEVKGLSDKVVELEIELNKTNWNVQTLNKHHKKAGDRRPCRWGSTPESPTVCSVLTASMWNLPVGVLGAPPCWYAEAGT